MQGKPIASYRRELSALDDLQCAGTVTYTLTQEEDAFVITAQRDGARAAAEAGVSGPAGAPLQEHCSAVKELSAGRLASP